MATVELPPLCIRAAVEPVDEQQRTIEVTFTTGAAVERLDWVTGRRYLERLSLKAEHVRLDRFNAGAPLLDAHSAYSIVDQIGVVEDGTVRLANGEARARVRFSKRDAVTPIWQDVKDRIITSVSVGYRVHKFEETPGKEGGLSTRLAVDWEPFEVSLVPMPADIGAKVRSDETVTHRCEIVTASAEPTNAGDPDVVARLRRLENQVTNLRLTVAQLG